MQLKNLIFSVGVLTLAAIAFFIILNRKEKKELFQYVILNVLPNGDVMWYSRGKPVQPYLLKCNDNPEINKFCNFLKARQGTYGYFYPPHQYGYQ